MKFSIRRKRINRAMKIWINGQIHVYVRVLIHDRLNWKAKISLRKFLKARGGLPDPKGSLSMPSATISLVKSEQSLDTFRGKCPVTVLFFITEMAYPSSGLLGSL